MTARNRKEKLNIASSFKLEESLKEAHECPHEVL